MQAGRKQMMDKAMAKRQRRAIKKHRPSPQVRQPGLRAKAQDLAKTAAITAADKFEEIAAAAAKKIKNAVS
jgi:hypothetical protein